MWLFSTVCFHMCHQIGGKTMKSRAVVLRLQMIKKRVRGEVWPLPKAGNPLTAQWCNTMQCTSMQCIKILHLQCIGSASQQCTASVHGGPLAPGRGLLSPAREIHIAVIQCSYPVPGIHYRRHTSPISPDNHYRISNHSDTLSSNIQRHFSAVIWKIISSRKCPRGSFIQILIIQLLVRVVCILNHNWASKSLFWFSQIW